MGFKETISKKYADAYYKKYGDRITQVQGHVLSVKITTKTILWMFNIFTADIVIKLDRTKSVVRCQYKVKKWFKMPGFMNLSQGHSVIVQGIKGKKGKENSDVISVVNIRNLTNKSDLIKVDQKIKKVQQRQYR
ncbi:hypothetical protein [Clostridium cylindrosporum]|uniref:Uncharacterized protein n=1 Tax=Clostridium cylindrosporum DSM 605 TaxID=1121307 RepID=A0A0J8G0S4_CLOCY|nr:hypothetical protein [Clostridium cylindrosporum]KMT21391.1 hypothetical protein CLCY_2c01510 [Clostridium cylindrosporum DSM 605]